MNWKAHLSPCYFERDISEIDYVSTRYFESSMEFLAVDAIAAFKASKRGRYGLIRGLCAGDFLSCTQNGKTRWFMVASDFPEFEVVKTSRESYLVRSHDDLITLEIPVGLLTI